MPLVFTVSLILLAALPPGITGGRGLFSPRMEFPEWKPLGRGDPLKDPTNEYLPPVLDKVHYWLPGEVRSSTHATTVSTTERMESRRDNYEPLLRYRRPPQYRYRPEPAIMLVPPQPQASTTWADTEATTTTEIGGTTGKPATSLLAALLLGTPSLPPSSQPPSSLPPSSQQPSSALPSSMPPPTTPSVPRMTTDPLFKHYKQPPEAIKGPMYLIIQGHSKVKKYGPGKIDPVSGISLQDSNEVSDNKSS